MKNWSSFWRCLGNCEKRSWTMSGSGRGTCLLLIGPIRRCSACSGCSLQKRREVGAPRSEFLEKVRMRQRPWRMQKSLVYRRILFMKRWKCTRTTSTNRAVHFSSAPGRLGDEVEEKRRGAIYMHTCCRIAVYVYVHALSKITYVLLYCLFFSRMTRLSTTSVLFLNSRFFISLRGYYTYTYVIMYI